MEDGKLKIALFTDSFLPIIDGVGRVVYNYAKYFSEHGHECYVICPQCDTGFRGGLPFEIVDFYSSHVPGTPQQYLAGLPTLDTNYTRRLDMIQPDIIHAHSPSVAGLDAVRYAKKTGAPLIGTFHSKYYDDVYEVTGSKAIAMFGARIVADFYDRCDEVWTVSEDARRTLESYGYKRNISIVPNGTGRRLTHPGQDAAGFLGSHGEPLLLYVGQIDYKKNIYLTLQACALLKKHGLRFRLALVGTGKDYESIREDVVRLGLTDEVVMPGHVYDPAMLASIYELASLFVFPSLYDTAGLVVREAAVMSTPSVVIENSAPAEVITDGVNGFCCLDSVDSLFSALSRALSDTDRLQKMGVTAYETIPVYWDDIFPDVLDRYRELIEQHDPCKKKRRRSMGKQ